MSESDDLILALRPVVVAFRATEIPYYVGVSVASSYHGASRSTMDVDLVCELDDSHVAPLLEELDDSYYASEQAIQQAVQRKSCFKLIHLPTSFKVDVFVSRKRAFDRECMRRAILATLGDSDSLEVALASAEDSILSKLEWFQMTNRTSERQWDDVSRLIRLLGDSADTSYMRRAAESIGVSDLLSRLLNGGSPVS